MACQKLGVAAGIAPEPVKLKQKETPWPEPRQGDLDALKTPEID
jgi:hypothetical protein